MSTKSPTQPVPLLVSRQLRPVSSESDGRRKNGAPENLYKDVMKYALYQEYSMEEASKFSFRTVEI